MFTSIRRLIQKVRHERERSGPHLETLDEVAVRPADLLRQPSEHAEAAARRHPDHLKSARYHHALLLVVRRGDALEALEDGVHSARGLHT